MPHQLPTGRRERKRKIRREGACQRTLLVRLLLGLLVGARMTLFTGRPRRDQQVDDVVYQLPFPDLAFRPPPAAGFPMLLFLDIRIHSTNMY